jgi:hypothetical protein
VAGQGDPHQPRLFTPAVAVVVGYVLVVGNPWLNRDLSFAVSDYDTPFRLIGVLFSYPSWHVDLDLVGPFLFWFANLRAVLFVGLTVAGLTRMSRWLGENPSGVALFVTTAGLTTLSAVIAELGSAAIGLALLGAGATDPYVGPDHPTEFFLNLFGGAASFGVLFGLVLGAVVVGQQRHAPADRERRVVPPKSFW